MSTYNVGYRSVLALNTHLKHESPKLIGSSLTRKKYKYDVINLKFEGLRRNIRVNKSSAIPTFTISDQDKAATSKLRCLSDRSRGRIKDKLHSWLFSEIEAARRTKKRPALTFVTLTFINKTDDKTAQKALNNFLTWTRKKDPNFEYLWVAERQHKNKAHPGNIHFHLFTNRYWNISYFNKYWVRCQNNVGIHFPTGQTKLNPFDVKRITQPKTLGIYMTKYVTKTKDKFACAAWNCSLTISRLATGRKYSDFCLRTEFDLFGSQAYMDKKIKRFRLVRKGRLKMYKAVKEYLANTPVYVTPFDVVLRQPNNEYINKQTGELIRAEIQSKWIKTARGQLLHLYNRIPVYNYSAVKSLMQEVHSWNAIILKTSKEQQPSIHIPRFLLH